jgi:hypothetical protein
MRGGAAGELPEYKWIDEFSRLFPRPLQSLASAVNSRGFPRNIPARMRSITYRHRSSLSRFPPSLLGLFADAGIRDSSGSAFLIGLWKCYDKNIVDRASVDFPHFYWPALIDFAFEGPLAAAMTYVKFRSSAFHRDPM